MDLTDHQPDDGPTAPADTPTRKTPRGVDPLSAAHRRRLLRALNTAAQNGDVAAQQALVELSLAAERDTQIAAALEQLNASEGEG
jgi:hypothetical protein